MPVILPTAPALRSASANEPPIRPTPTMTRFSMRRTRSGFQRLFEGAKELAVLLRRPDRHAQVVGHLVAGQGAHDDAALEELVVHGAPGGLVAFPRDAHADEIRHRRDPFQAEA